MGGNAEYHRRYRKLHPEKEKIKWWKKYGIKLRENEDWDSVYLYYITCEECDNCGVELCDSKNNTAERRTLDHDHSTGYIRNVLCFKCNLNIH